MNMNSSVVKTDFGQKTGHCWPFMHQWYLIHDTWHMTYNTWHMIHDPWCMIHETWYIIHDSIQLSPGRSFYSIVLHVIWLCSMVLHDIIIYSIVLHVIAWYFIVLHVFAFIHDFVQFLVCTLVIPFHCMALHGIVLHSISLHDNTRCCTVNWVRRQTTA